MEQLSAQIANLTKKSIEGQKPSWKNALSRKLIAVLQGKNPDKVIEPTIKEEPVIKEEPEQSKETVVQHKQWTSVENDLSYERFNPDPETGLQKFFKEVMGPYGNPFIIPEPDLAFDVPAALQYVNIKGEPKDLDKSGFKYINLKGAEVWQKNKISGIICQDGGTDVYRFSFSNPKAPKFEVNEEGVTIDGEQWYLKVLFSKDAQRIGNFDAYYSRTKPSVVRVIEMGDINWDQI